VANAIVSRREKNAIKIVNCLIKHFLVASFVRLRCLRHKPWKFCPSHGWWGAPKLSCALEIQGSRLVESHISQKTSEIPEFPARGSKKSSVCGFLYGKPHGVHWFQQAPQEIRGMGHPAVIAGTELDGEGGRRPAGSGAAKYACCDSICNQLPVEAGDSKGEAGAGGEIGRDGNRGDGAKALTIRARWLAQRRRCVRRCIRHGTHDAGMSTMSAAADGQ
jgi:hypothetical protein